MANPAFGLEGLGALVVGGGSGIGRATALLLADTGADVAVADLDAARADDVSREAEKRGVTALALTGDVTTADGATAVVSNARAGLGRLDVVVNIVGLASWSSILDLDDETWEHDLRINLTHHLHVGRAAARQFIADATPGRIAMVASVSGIYGAPMHSAYGAAKAAVMGLARSMANEWGQYGIRVNCVAPDIIATPRVRQGFAAQGIEDIDTVPASEGVPLARFGTPEEIAGPLVFLVSDLAGFMTGQTLVVDGGTMACFPHQGPKAFSPAS